MHRRLPTMPLLLDLDHFLVYKNAFQIGIVPHNETITNMRITHLNEFCHKSNHIFFYQCDSSLYIICYCVHSTYTHNYNIVYMKYSIISRSLVWLFIAMSVVFCFCFWFWYSLFHSVSGIAIQCVILHRLLYYTDDRSDVAAATALVLVCWNVLLLVHSVKVCTPLMKHHHMCALKQSYANLTNNQLKVAQKSVAFII